MVQTSWAWDRAFERTVVPETFVEISMGVIDTWATENARQTVFNEAIGSNHGAILSMSANTEPKNYASLEENRWLLDGSKTVRWNEDTGETGFVGYPPTGSDMWYVQFDLPQDTTTVVPGLTIVWDSEFGEKPSHYYVGFKNAVNDTYMIMVEDGKVSLQEVHGSDGVGIPITFDKIEDDAFGVTKLTGSFSGYNMIQITILKWNTPNHRPRLDRFVFGYIWVFDKKDLLSYTHEQSGDPLGLELPKNSITFSVDNSDGRWNPNNPEGFGKYLINRQMLTVRYGVDLGYDTYGAGRIEWIPAGIFYLSEWDAPANGLEATFTARDPFEFMLDIMYHDGVTYGSHLDFVNSALAMCNFPNEIQANIRVGGFSDDVQLPNDKMDRYGYAGYTVGEVIQCCVNAMASVCYFDREGVLQVKASRDLREVQGVFGIPEDVTYSHPEVTLNKPIRWVEISYYPIWLSEEKCDFVRFNVTLNDGRLVEEGETLRIANDFIQRNKTATDVYASIQPIVRHRRQVTGEFRANPCLDLFDWVNIHSKYGQMKMMLTRIKYTYNGSFRAEYTAREMDYREVTE